MKSLSALFFIAITFTACKKTKTETPATARNKIVGQWNIQAVTVIPRDSTGKIMNPGTTYPEPSYYYFNFNTDGTWVEVLSPNTPSDIGESGSYILHTDTTFTLINSNLPGSNVECKITALSNTAFVFSHQRTTLFNGVTPGYLEYVFSLKK